MFLMFVTALSKHWQSPPKYRQTDTHVSFPVSLEIDSYHLQDGSVTVVQGDETDAEHRYTDLRLSQTSTDGEL